MHSVQYKKKLGDSAIDTEFRYVIFKINDLIFCVAVMLRMYQHLSECRPVCMIEL